MPKQANSRITILYVTSDFGVGGTEFLLVKLLKGLAPGKPYVRPRR